MQRDLYSAFLLAYLEPEQTYTLYHPATSGKVRSRACRAVMEELQQRANEGQHLPRSMGLVARRKSGAARAGARRLKVLPIPTKSRLSPSGETGNGG